MDTLIQATPEYNPENCILFVDDDANLLRAMRKLFASTYDVKTAMSAKEAITTIKLGFVPGVIVADLDMPQILGSQLLANIHKIVPNSSNILLVNHYDSPEIAEYLTVAKAFHFLFKPFTDLDIKQSVKIAFERYKLLKALSIQKKSIEHYVKQSQVLHEKIHSAELDNITIKDEYNELISEVVNTNLKYIFFTNKSEFVKKIALAIAQKMNIRTDNLVLIEKLANLLPLIYANFPVRYKVADPFEFSNVNDIEIFIAIFNKNFEKFKRYTRFNKYFNILEQVYEHHDGTGLPKNVKENDIYKEAMVLSIANMYHDNVYKVSADDWDKLASSNGGITQSAQVTKQRHEQTLKLINKRSSWFSFEVFTAFYKVLNEGQCKELVPINVDLKISL